MKQEMDLERAKEIIVNWAKSKPFMNKVYLNPILYLQNAHVFNFYYSYLKVFFEKLGLEVIYGDEQCTFLLHKCEGWKKPEVKMIYEKSLSDYPEKINVFIRKTNFLYKYSFRINIHQMTY